MLNRIHLLVLLRKGSGFVILSGTEGLHGLKVFIEALVLVLVEALHLHLRRVVQLPVDIALRLLNRELLLP